MRILVTFDTTRNPGRAASWNVRAEATALMDAGANGLAGLILAHGFSDLYPVLTLPAAGETMGDVCADILAAADDRKSEGGTVRPIINGTKVDTFRARLEKVASMAADRIVVDGRRRVIASLIAYGCGRDDIVIATRDYNGDTTAAERDAFKGNYLLTLARSLDPWAKVEAGERLLADKPSTTEAELMAYYGVKRGDAQLMHRAALAIRKHRLALDRSKRCPGKEDWKAAVDAETAEGASAIVASVQNGTRDKSVGVDKVASALQSLPEGTNVDARAFGRILATGSRALLDSALAALAEGKPLPPVPVKEGKADK